MIKKRQDEFFVILSTFDKHDKTKLLVNFKKKFVDWV